MEKGRIHGSGNGSVSANGESENTPQQSKEFRLGYRVSFDFNFRV